MRDNTNVFPEFFIDKDLFQNILGKVITRGFNINNESCIIPMADNFNHSSDVHITNEIVCLLLHTNQNTIQ